MQLSTAARPSQRSVSTIIGDSAQAKVLGRFRGLSDKGARVWAVTVQTVRDGRTAFGPSCSMSEIVELPRGFLREEHVQQGDTCIVVAVLPEAVETWCRKFTRCSYSVAFSADGSGQIEFESIVDAIEFTFCWL